MARTLAEVIADLRSQIDTRLAERGTAARSIQEVLIACESGDEHRDPTDDEAARVEAANTTRERLDGEIAQLRARLAPFEAEQSRQDEDDNARRDTRETLERRGGAQVNSPRTYSRENDPKGVGFLRDVALDFLGNREARDRIYQHLQEERVERGDVLTRAVSTSSPGLVVPQYLVDLYAPKGRAGRKFADICTHHDLPETGMTAYIPRQTAKTSVGIQATENTTVSENDYDDENVSVPIRTAAGSQTISRQAVERSLGLEAVVANDLFKAYNTDLDSQLINASTWGLAAVAKVITFTDTAPVVSDLYGKVQQGSANVETLLLDLDNEELATVMHGRRWAWIKNQMTDKWPFINAGVPGQAVGESDDTRYASAVRGHWPDGGNIVTDNNITTADGSGTNQDQVFVVARQEAHLWEDPNAPMFIRAEQSQVKKLSIDYVLYGYFAAIFNRVVDSDSKAAHQLISGTGLVTPTF